MSRVLTVVIVILFGVALAFLVYWFLFKFKNNIRTQLLPSSTNPSVVLDKTAWEEKYDIDVPLDVNKIELKDVTDSGFLGIATRKYESGMFSHTVLADLSDPLDNYFYQGWLIDPLTEKYIQTGKMEISKGGYLLEYFSKIDYSKYNKVVITLEAINDRIPEKHILEGQF